MSLQFIPASFTHEILAVFCPTRVSLPVRYGRVRAGTEQAAGYRTQPVSRGGEVDAVAKKAAVGDCDPGKKDPRPQMYSGEIE
jgi:hypothetical protein